MSHTLEHLNRVPVNFISSKVKEILPEHFATDYPNLVEFLDEYYHYMEKDDVGFSYFISYLNQIRDLNTTFLSQLDNIFDEIGLGTSYADFDINPRLIAKLFANFYREKGTANSAKLFFRGFFDEEIEIEYPKNNIFIVNESRLGSDSLKYIQNDERYQIYSILIKSSIPISRWEALYKRFVHPAGWYLSSDVFVEGVVNLGLADMPISILDSNAGLITIENNVVTAPAITFEPLTLIITDDGDSDLYAERINPNKLLKSFVNNTLAQFDNQYNSFIEFQDENSPRFDQDSDGIIVSVDFSNSAETMDQSNFDYLDSTNNTFQYIDLP